MKAGAPVDLHKLVEEQKRASKLYNAAKAAAAEGAKRCAPAEQPKRQEPQTSTTVTPPSPQSLTPKLSLSLPNPELRLESDALDALEQLDDALDDCDPDAVKALLPKLNELARRARQLAAAALAKGPSGQRDAAYFEALAKDLDDAGFEAAMTGGIIDMCQKQSKLPSPPAASPEPRPTPPKHSVVEDLFPKTPPPPPPAGPPKTTSGLPLPLTPFASRVLALHNRERAAVGAPPLQWDPELAQSATAYGAEMARSGQFAHSSREGRGTVRENINQAFHGSSPDQLMANWLGEKRHFRAGLFPNVSDTGNWYDVGHYSQIIWPTTLSVGCGEATGARWDYFVCRYSPGGNRDGQAVGTAVGF